MMKPLGVLWFTTVVGRFAVKARIAPAALSTIREGVPKKQTGE